VVALARRHPVIAFYVLAFAWTWTFVIVFLVHAAIAEARSVVPAYSTP
jgi:hypothetical protein